VYAALLSSCPLSSADRAYLRSSGIPEHELSGYGTLSGDRRAILRSLERRFSRATLVSVPGFFERADGRLSLAGSYGILVAIISCEKQISGVQIRSQEENGSKIYRWLSSTRHDGPASGAPAHVVLRADERLIWITEGAKKAHVASTYTGATTIGLPGYATHGTGLGALDTLIERGALGVVIALDCDPDPLTAAAVEASRQSLVGACLARGLAVRIARWEPAQAKGIDDLLHAGHQPQIEIVTAQAKPDDPGSTAGGRRLSTPEQAARYREVRRVLWNVDAEQRKASMTPAEKLALLLQYEMTDLYPGTVAAGGCVEPVTINMSALGARIGVSAKVASKAISHLAEAGIIDRLDEREAITGNHIIAVAPARRLAFNEVLTASEHHVRDASRKRCKHCGSDHIRTTHTCEECGNVEVEMASLLESRLGPPQPPETPLDHYSIADRSLEGPTEELAVGILPEETCAGEESPPLDQILAAIGEAGVQLRLTATFPLKILAAPASALTDDVSALIRDYREELIDYLYDRADQDGSLYAAVAAMRDPER
jgi:hypothetical protein